MVLLHCSGSYSKTNIVNQRAFTAEVLFVHLTALDLPPQHNLHQLGNQKCVMLVDSTCKKMSVTSHTIHKLVYYFQPSTTKKLVNVCLDFKSSCPMNRKLSIQCNYLHSMTYFITAITISAGQNTCIYINVLISSLDHSRLAYP